MTCNEKGPEWVIRGRMRHNAWWIAVLTVAVIVTGMAYSLWWAVTVRHSSFDYWIYPFDLFGTIRASGWIEYGGFSYLYTLHSGIVTLPGFAILLTPVVQLSQALHLSTTAPPTFVVPRPSQWLLIGPVSMVISAVGLAGLDALARTLDISLVRRRLLLVAEAAVIWAVIVRWGHPEDVIALGLGALALSRAVEGRTVSAGWLLGGALSMQLYVVLLIPIFIGLLGVRRSMALLARAAVLPGAILLALLIPNAHATLHVLLDQPTPPKVNHPTPWVFVAPHLGHGEVAGGPGRIIGLVGACLVGLFASRHRNDASIIVWLAAVSLALRCLTEAVMTPYYVAPAIALVLIAVASRSWRRWGLVVVSGSALTVLTYYRPGIWWYWFEMVAAFAVMLAAARSRPSKVIAPSANAVLSSADPDGPLAASEPVLLH